MGRSHRRSRPVRGEARGQHSRYPTGRRRCVGAERHRLQSCSARRGEHVPAIRGVGGVAVGGDEGTGGRAEQTPTFIDDLLGDSGMFAETEQWTACRCCSTTRRTKGPLVVAVRVRQLRNFFSTGCCSSFSGTWRVPNVNSTLNAKGERFGGHSGRNWTGV